MDFKGATVVIPREMKNYSANGWYGSDRPDLATKEWGDAMLNAMADYIADFVVEFEKVELPRPEI